METGCVSFTNEVHQQEGIVKMSNLMNVTPPGLNCIYSELRKIYPNQHNPLQVTALVKYWLNGPDPLDYVSMFANVGDPMRGIPPHWHYISCGLSDLHGDGRVHDVTRDDGPSGYGFELTFRLQRAPDEHVPPTWPAELMQNLAKYVFQSDTILCSGDHVSRHASLDFQHSFIQQMLVTEDAQLSQIMTPFGYVNFVQVIGVCTEELYAAQQWNGPAVINLLRQIPATGGPWLVTDMARNKSVFQMCPNFRELVEVGIDQDGSNLSGVSAKCWWGECSKDTILESASKAINCHSDPSSSSLSVRIRSSLANYRSEVAENDEMNSASRMSNYSSVSDLLRARPITDGLQLRFNLEAATFLHLAIRGRLAHGRHFTFKSASSESAITFVSRDITGTSVDQKFPYAALRSWLQVLIPDDFLETLAHDFDDLQRPEEESFLAEDLVFIQYFNNFLSLPVFPQRLSYNKTSGCFEEFHNTLADDINEVGDSREAASLNYQVKSTIDEKKRRICYYVKFLGKQQGLDWVKNHRLPLFLQSEIYADYKLSRLLSLAQIDFLKKLLCEGCTEIRYGSQERNKLQKLPQKPKNEKSFLFNSSDSETEEETKTLMHVDGKNISILPKWQQELFVNSINDNIDTSTQSYHTTDSTKGKKERTNQDSEKRYVDDTVDTWKKKYWIEPKFCRRHSSLASVEEVSEGSESECVVDWESDIEQKQHEASELFYPTKNSCSVDLRIEITSNTSDSCEASVASEIGSFLSPNDEYEYYERHQQTVKTLSTENVDYYMGPLSQKKYVEDIKSFIVSQEVCYKTNDIDCHDSDINGILNAADENQTTLKNTEREVSADIENILRSTSLSPLNLCYKEALDAFKEFLFGTPGEKNLLLWLDVERSRHFDQVDRRRTLKSLKDRFIRSGALYEIPSEIRKTWGLAGVSDISMERLIFIRRKILDPLLKYWCPRFTLHHYIQNKKYINEVYDDIVKHDYTKAHSLGKLPQRPLSYGNHLKTEGKIDSNGLFTDSDSRILSEDQCENVVTSITRRKLQTKSAYPRLISSKLTHNTNAGTEQLQLVSSFKDEGFGFKPPTMKYFHNDASSNDYKSNVRLYIQPVPPFNSTASTVKTTPNFREEELGESEAYQKDLDSLIETLLHERHTGNYFFKFLQEQNVKLWIDCYMFWCTLQEYNEYFFADCFNPLAVQRKANFIYTTYVTSNSEHDVRCSLDMQSKIYKQLHPPYEDLFDCVEQQTLDVLLQPWVALVNKERHLYKELKPEVQLKYIEVNTKKRYNYQSELEELRTDESGNVSAEKKKDKVSPEEILKPLPVSKDGVNFESLLKDKQELEHFQAFLESTHKQGITDLTAWTDMEVFKRLGHAVNDKQKEDRDKKATDIREKWLNKSYFFGEKSPATRGAVKKIMELAGGVKVLPQRPSSPVILEAQKYSRARVERRFIMLYKETKDYQERRKQKSNVTELVEDLLMKKKIQRSEHAWRLLNSRWNSSSRDVTVLRMALTNPEECELFRKFIRVRGDMMENNLNFWLEVQKFKELCHSHVEDSLIKHKVQTIIDVFIKSAVPPELQIDVPIEIGERLYDKACGRSPHYGPYLFREAQTVVFRIMYNFWKKYHIFRSQQKAKEVDLSRSLQNLQKQHAYAITKKKLLAERKRLSKLVNEKRKRENISKGRERSKPDDLISYLTKTVQSTTEGEHEHDVTSFTYSKYTAEQELKSLEARMKEEGISANDDPSSRRSFNATGKGNSVADNTSEASPVRTKRSTTNVSEEEVNRALNATEQTMNNTKNKSRFASETRNKGLLTQHDRSRGKSTCGKSSDTRMSWSSHKASDKKKLNKMSRVSKFQNVIPAQFEEMKELSENKRSNTLMMKPLKDSETSPKRKPFKQAGMFDCTAAPISDVIELTNIDNVTCSKPDIPRKVMKNIVLNPRLPRNAGTAAILRELEKSKPRVESPPPEIIAEVVVC